MLRRIIHIDEEKCNGCGACATACHEGAIEMIDGKAKLTREDYCDGLGDCLPVCPVDAIHFEEREAPAYNEEAVLAAQKNKSEGKNVNHLHSGCPGSRIIMMKQDDQNNKEKNNEINYNNMPAFSNNMKPRLAQWPCQIKLVPVNASYFDGARLLIAADCTAYAYANFHQEFMKGKVTLIGCPKLDDIDYSDKLTEIIRNNDIKSVTVLKMEVPCCGGIEYAAKKALQESGKFIPWQVVTIAVDGRILD